MYILVASTYKRSVSVLAFTNRCWLNLNTNSNLTYTQFSPPVSLVVTLRKTNSPPSFPPYPTQTSVCLLLLRGANSDLCQFICSWQHSTPSCSPYSCECVNATMELSLSLRCWPKDRNDANVSSALLSHRKSLERMKGPHCIAPFYTHTHSHTH